MDGSTFFMLIGYLPTSQGIQKLRPTQTRDYVMKKTTLCLMFALLALLTSCRTSEKVRSTTSYKKAVAEAQRELATDGYLLYDTKQSSDIDGTRHDIYKLKDTLGNTMEYNVTYNVKNDDDIYYVENVQVGGCVTTDGKNYEKLCGIESPVNKIEKLEYDKKISHVSAGKTIFFLVGVPAIIVAGLVGIVVVGLAAAA